MKNKLPNYLKKGSTIFIVVALLVALFLFFGGFLKYSTSRRYTTGKLNKSYLIRELSYSIATLAAHQIKETEIKNKSGRLYKQLSLPTSQMKSEESQNLQLSSDLSNLLKKLIAENPCFSDLNYNVEWQVKKDSFKPLTDAYPREKFGKLFIRITTNYKLAGAKDLLQENYIYALKTRVTANIIPVLSRFSLYIKDAVCGGAEDRFNKVETDMYGNLLNSTFRPWIVDNGNVGNTNFPVRFSDLLESPVGLIYLGGGKIVLGNCRGWNNVGMYGEGFHLMSEGRGDGFYTTSYINKMAIINWETGLCNDLSDNSTKFWWELIKDGYDVISRRNSIFRLMGTDKFRSPTLVFGDVSALTLCAKAFKEGNNFFGPLPYVNNQARFLDICSGGSEDFDIGYFKSVVGNITREKYNSEYASHMMEIPYNRSLSYIVTNHKNPQPMKSGVIAQSDYLYDFINGKALTRGLTNKIPAPYGNIYSDIADLNEMRKLLAKIEIPGNRVLKTLELKKGEKLLDRLRLEGYLQSNKLDINGWLYIKTKASIIIDKNLLLMSHGGLVFEQANVELKGSINCGSDKFLLHLVTLNGNIKIAEHVGGELYVSLVAAGNESNTGQIKLIGTNNSICPIIMGNVAMERLSKDGLNNYTARGLNIKYNKELAALPKKTSDNMSEKSLLMFGIETEAKLVE